jgi:Uncharacterised nucleotidyltransferase
MVTATTLESSSLPFDPRGEGPVWERVERLLARTDDLDALRAHRLHLLAACRRRRLGLPVPPELDAELLRSAWIALLTPLVLVAARQAYGGRMVLLKGLEVSACYPEPSTRPFTDADLLVDDAAAAQHALLAAGFLEVGDPARYVGIHHRRPLVHPELPVPVELHETPKWLPWARAPLASELLDRAVPGQARVDGVLALPAAEHAVVLAVHSWAHEPLRRALELVDVAAVASGADPAETEALAGAWGVGRVWRTTTRAVESLLQGSRLPPPAGLWARGLVEVRERTVLESHLERWLGRFSEQSFPRALAEVPGALLADLRRHAGDSWSRKARRSAIAVQHALRPRSHHDRIVETRGVGPARAGERSGR